MRHTCLALFTIVLSLGSATVAHADEVTFSFQVSGTVSFLSPPPLANFQSSAAGVINPFGSGSYSASGQINFGVINPNGSSPASGSFVFTVANGDTFFGTFTEEVFPPNQFGIASFTHVFTITGGTGIFTGASGTAFSPSGTVNLATNAITITGTGSISAPGLVAIPEPTTLFLLGTGLGGVALKARRRSRRC